MPATGNTDVVLPPVPPPIVTRRCKNCGAPCRANIAMSADNRPRVALVLCTQYRLRDAAALATYLREHAPRLRADDMEKFGGRFRADRRVLIPVASY